MAFKADRPGHSLRSRRRHRCAGPRHRAKTLRTPQATGRCRKQGRCQRPNRRGVCRQGKARWLHPVDVNQRLALGQPQPVQDTALGPDQGLYANRAHRRPALRNRGQRGLADQKRQGPDRLCARQSRQSLVRHAQQHLACVLGDHPRYGQDRHPRRSLHDDLIQGAAGISSLLQSVRLDAGGIHHLFPARQLPFQELGELLRCIGHHLKALRVQPRFVIR